MINITRLKVLRELHRRGTLSAVAENLCYSTSAVSQQIRQLEREVGVSLVEPVGRRLHLTPQGLILVEHATRILDLVEQAEADISMSLERPRGTVRLAAFQSAAISLVPRAVSILREQHPELTVEFQQGEPEQTLSALQAADLDLVIAEAYPGIPVPATPGLRFEHLLDDPLWLAMDEATFTSVDPGRNVFAQLAEAGWAAEAADSVPRAWVVNQCRQQGFEPRIVCSSEDLAVQLRFVEAGLAVAVLPRLALELATSSLRTLPASSEMESRQVLVAYREAARNRTAVVAMRAALEQAAESFTSS
ncbi:LysR substrate-binding domain-containing protein [Nocardioides panacihumi]|uniref:LysR substrate-binding domain-containing protein n=1 Tax=Nocardioides panacihumi TaxID=400774 RepID=A0ABN2QFB5_9ACTN